MYQGKPICASACRDYFVRDGSCTRNAAVGYWPLAGENIGDFIDAGDPVRSRRFFSPFLAPQARAQRSESFLLVPAAINVIIGFLAGNSLLHWRA